MYYFYQAYYQENSNGISCVYEMVRILNENGIPARIVCTQDEDFCVRYYKPLPEKYRSMYIPKGTLPEILGEDDTAIIQDVFEGELPQNVSVVRWLLNKPICLSGKPIDYSPTEFVIAYSNYINEKLPQLFMIKDERTLLKDIRDSETKFQDMVSVYFGKVHLNVLYEKKELLQTILRKYKKVNVITRWNPSDRRDTLKLLAQSDLLISFDPLSNTNHEACLLGTPTLMLDDSFNIKDKKFNINNDGWFFEYEDINIAKEKAKTTFQYYCEWLEVQNQSIVDFFNWLIKKMEKLKNDPEEQHVNALWNQSLKEQDMDYYVNNFNSDPFVGINTVYDLPPEIAELFEINNYWAKHMSRRLRTKVVSVLRKADMIDHVLKVYSIFKHKNGGTDN